MASPRIRRKHFLLTGLTAVVAAVTAAGRRSLGLSTASSSAPAVTAQPAPRTVARTDLV